MSYLYLLYRNIDMNDPRMDDFILKFGKTKGDSKNYSRIKSYNTVLSSDGLKAFTWSYIGDVDSAEKDILKILNDKGYLRKHSSGKNSEVISIKITLSMTFDDAIILYNKTISDVRNIIDRYLSKIDLQTPINQIWNEDEYRKITTTCIAHKKNGDKCENFVRPGAKYCGIHIKLQPKKQKIHNIDGDSVLNQIRTHAKLGEICEAADLYLAYLNICRDTNVSHMPIEDFGTLINNDPTIETTIISGKLHCIFK